MEASVKKPVLPSGAGKPAKGPAYMKAGEFARRAGVTRQSVHLYVQMGLLHPAIITRGKQRLFAPGDLVRVALIRKLCATRYSLSEIRETFLKDK